MSQKISKIALEFLEKDNRFCHLNNIGYGDLDILHEVFEKSGAKLKNNHPLNKCNYVLNAIDRESKQKGAIFEKEYFRSYKGLARIFVIKLKPKSDNDAKQ